KETADHSLPYVIAAALVDRQVTPLQFTPEKIMDAGIRAQLKKVKVVADPEIEKVFPALQRVVVTICTTDGRELTKQLDYPKGDPRNPLSDKEVEEKFAALAAGVLTPARQRQVIEAVWKLEKQGSVSDLMHMLTAEA
ncbi:MAG TPA: MmgE/PrpD family protein, partial [Terriglobales bacterium]|nr:MmgE/PrpD family protein [Terriglobales bacterium]